MAVQKENNRTCDVMIESKRQFSENLPLIYRVSARVLSGISEKKGTVKNLIYSDRILKHRCSLKKAAFALVLQTLKHKKIIEAILEETQLLQKNLINHSLATILTYDLLFGSGELRGHCQSVKVLQENKKILSRTLKKLKSNPAFQTLFSSVLEVRKILPRYARINTLVSSLENVSRHLTKNGFQQVTWNDDISFPQFLELVQSLKENEFILDFHFAELLVFHPKVALYSLKIYENGSIILQDKTSIFPVHILNPPPDSIVFDACAAPGIKTTHLAALMKNSGTIYATDLSANRMRVLDTTLKRASVKNCLFTRGNFSFIDPEDESFAQVEYILLDPSCSGSGMVSRMDDLTDDNDSKTSERFLKLQGFQVALLRHSMKFPHIKRIVYSTCSVNVEENEEVVKQALGYFPGEFEVVDAFPEWPVRGNEEYEFGAKCVRANPLEHLTNGFFVAALDRCHNSVEGTVSTSDKKLKKKSKKSVKDEGGDVFDVPTRNKENANVPTDPDIEYSKQFEISANSVKKQRKSKESKIVEISDSHQNIYLRDSKKKKDRRIDNKMEEHKLVTEGNTSAILHISHHKKSKKKSEKGNNEGDKNGFGTICDVLTNDSKGNANVNELKDPEHQRSEQYENSHPQFSDKKLRKTTEESSKLEVCSINQDIDLHDSKKKTKGRHTDNKPEEHKLVTERNTSAILDISHHKMSKKKVKNSNNVGNGNELGTICDVLTNDSEENANVNESKDPEQCENFSNKKWRKTTEESKVEVCSVNQDIDLRDSKKKKDKHGPDELGIEGNTASILHSYSHHKMKQKLSKNLQPDEGLMSHGTKFQDKQQHGYFGVTTNDYEETTVTSKSGDGSISKMKQDKEKFCNELESSARKKKKKHSKTPSQLDFIECEKEICEDGYFTLKEEGLLDVPPKEKSCKKKKQETSLVTHESFSNSTVTKKKKRKHTKEKFESKMSEREITEAVDLTKTNSKFDRDEKRVETLKNVNDDSNMFSEKKKKHKSSRSEQLPAVDPLGSNPSDSILVTDVGTCHKKKKSKHLFEKFPSDLPSLENESQQQKLNIDDSLSESLDCDKNLNVKNEPRVKRCKKSIMQDDSYYANENITENKSSLVKKKKKRVM